MRLKRDTENSSSPSLIEGNLAVDDRGAVSYVNDFRFDEVKRFYMITNHRAGFIRAWHAHQREAKYMTVVDGAAVIAAVAIDNWERPSKATRVHRFVLSASRPAVLFIPRGHANGFMSLTSDCKIMVFSTATLKESEKDDVRYDARYWDVWEIAER
jgi:dTDP-4-dehydrorhamnose 3,5-epimerase